MKKFLIAVATLSFLMSGCTTYSSHTIYTTGANMCERGLCNFETSLQTDAGKHKIITVHVPNHFAPIPTKDGYLLFFSSTSKAVLTLEKHQGTRKDSRALIDDFLDKTANKSVKSTLVDKTHSTNGEVLHSKARMIYDRVGDPGQPKAMMAIEAYSTSYDAVVIAYSLPLSSSAEETKKG